MNHVIIAMNVLNLIMIIVKNVVNYYFVNGDRNASKVLNVSSVIVLDVLNVKNLLLNVIVKKTKILKMKLSKKRKGKENINNVKKGHNSEMMDIKVILNTCLVVHFKIKNNSKSIWKKKKNNGKY